VAVLFTVRRITSDGHALSSGDHLAFPEASGDRTHLHVLRVDGGDHAATILVDAASTALLDVHTTLTRVVPAAATAVLPIEGMPPGVDHDDQAQPPRAPCGLDTAEAAGSGPGYDPFK